MNAVNASAGENAMRDLLETAFTAGEPALPAVDDVMTTVELLGGRIRHRQRVRTGIAAGALCIAACGMVAGIATVAHSNHSGGSTVVFPGGGGQAPPPASQTTLSGNTQSSGAGGSGGGLNRGDP